MGMPACTSKHRAAVLGGGCTPTTDSAAVRNLAPIRGGPQQGNARPVRGRRRAPDARFSGRLACGVWLMLGLR